jgi:RNA-dependent RNA polymerase
LFDLFQGPYREKKRNKLQKVVGDDNVLIVNFSDSILGNRDVGDNIATYYSPCIQFAEDGIMLGLRRYRFLSKFPCLKMQHILGYV